jgi:hypothetical protein
VETVAAVGNIIRNTVAVPRIPTGQRPINSAAQREAIPWRIAKQMPDSGNQAESATAAGLAIEAESATAVALEITVVALGITAEELEITVVALGITAVELEIIAAEPETEEATVRALGPATGARIVEWAAGTALETEVFRREQTALPGEVPSADREAAPAAHARAVREVRRAWAGEVAAVVVAAVVGEEGNR